MAIKVVNSSPGTINVTVNEIPKINVSVTSSSAINIEPGITTGERSKLAGIESGATADQTDAEIKTAYENNANTNAFTDAEQTKLSGIDVSADVTDATTVLAAGAVMTTGDQTIAGNKTFSGNTVLGTTVAGAIATTGSVSILSSQNLTVTGALSVSGTSNLQGAVSFDSDLQAPALKFTGSGTNIIGPLGTGGTQDDLEIQSNGNVTVKLDSDNDESGQKLKVVNNSGTEKFSVQEDGTVTVYGKIVSDSGGDIDIEPNGSGDVLLGNFKFDADQSVGDAQNDFVLTYDSGTGKISLEAATGGTSTLLGLSDTPSSFTASKFVKVNSAGNAIEFVDDSNLNALVTMLKSGSTTTLTSIGDGTSTDKGVLNLGASSASLKFNTTGITIDEASPGDIEFIVATDSSGSTAFTAAHIDGGTSANSADFLIKNGTAFKIEGASGSARLSHTGGNVALTLPSSTGTLALTSQITSDTNTQNSYAISCVDGDNSDEEKIRLTQSGADGAATDDIVLEAGTGLSIARSGDKITFTNTVSDTNTQNAYAISCVDGDNSDEEKIRLTQSGAAGSATDDIVLEAGTGLSIARAGDKITFTNTVTDTNTTDLVTDTSPQLGGNLDVNGQDIVTTSNGDIELDPNGTGKVVFKGNSDKGAGQFVLNCEQNSHGIVIKGPPHSAGASYTLTLPNTDGSANEVLKTDGSGNLDWVAQTTDTNTQNTTTLSFVDSSDDIILRNTTGGAGSGTQDIKFVAGSNITLTHTDADNITIAASGSGGSSTFVGLSDTPGSFTASKFLKVNSAGNAIEFVDNPSGGLSNVVEDTTPQLGGDLDTNGKNVLFAKTGNTDHSSNGDIVKIGTGSTTQGELCYYTSSGTWVAADADATGTAGGVLLAIALGTDPDVDGMLLRGMYTLDHDPGTVGDELYVSTTAGDITSTAPSGTGDVVRVIGYCLDSTNGQIWFNPSNDFIVLA